jgi:predicted XRE-type DNA-binding protein
MMSKLEHIGSSFDDFLEEEGIKTEVSVSALKRTLAWKIQDVMKKQELSKAQMAEKLETSRSGLDRLIDPENTSITLNTIEKVAKKLGIEIHVTMTEPDPVFTTK